MPGFQTRATPRWSRRAFHRSATRATPVAWRAATRPFAGPPRLYRQYARGRLRRPGGSVVPCIRAPCGRRKSAASNPPCFFASASPKPWGYPVVEAPGELGGDGLDGNLLVGNGGQDDEQFRRGLRRIGLVHGDLGDELAAAALLVHVTVDGARLLYGGQVLESDARNGLAVEGEGFADARDADGSKEFRMTLDESLDAIRLGRLADGRGYIERVEIASLDEAVHGAEVDVIGIHVVRVF